MGRPTNCAVDATPVRPDAHQSDYDVLNSSCACSRSNSRTSSARLCVETSSPSLSSPSLTSSFLSSSSPLCRQLDDNDPASRVSRHELVRCLSQLAHHLTYPNGHCPDHLDQLQSLDLDSPDNLERAAAVTPCPVPRRTIGLGLRSHSKGASLAASPASPASFLRTRFSDLSASLHRKRESERQLREQQSRRTGPQKMSMTVEQANKVIAEMDKLNDELSTVVTNLRARQEESDHIHDLLIERAERAAQRVIFLQNRVAYLEDELQENDDELQHLRICLKAIEIQMPPHPDKELQRCITTFKHDYQALKQKRAACASLAYLDSSSYMDYQGNDPL